jgi:hypothetical protein
VATCVLGCYVCIECRAAHHSLKHMLHNTVKLITMYFYWLILQKCNFSKAQPKLPEDGPEGPKNVGPNIEIF